VLRAGLMDAVAHKQGLTPMSNRIAALPAALLASLAFLLSAGACPAQERPSWPGGGDRSYQQRDDGQPNEEAARTPSQRYEAPSSGSNEPTPDPKAPRPAKTRAGASDEYHPRQRAAQSDEYHPPPRTVQGYDAPRSGADYGAPRPGDSPQGAPGGYGQPYPPPQGYSQPYPAQPGYGQPYPPPPYGRPYGPPPGEAFNNDPADRGYGQPGARYEEPAPGSYSSREILDAGHGFFGSISKGLASVVEYAFQKQGRPNGYILGQDAGGAFVAGVRYGEGTLYTKDAGTHRVYWQGPSIGWDAGAEGSKVMMLVYNLTDPEEIYQRFGGIDGSAYLVGGVGITFQKSGDVIVAPIRAGVGLRLGANIGYLKYTRRPTWNPF